MDEKAEVHVVTIITRGSAGAQVLVEPEGRGWRLPSFTLAGLPDSRAVAPALRAAVAERFGLAVAVLSLLHDQRGKAGGPRNALVALDAFTAPTDGAEAAGSAWLSVDELTQVAFAGEAEGARVYQWLADLVPGAGHALGWTRPGWLGEASQWIEAQLAQHGLTLAGPIEQQRTWSLSALLRAPLSAGSAYFKALPPLFASEPSITQALARRFPGRFPEVMAIDAERGWLLMREFSGQLLQACSDLTVWSDALRQYARLQVAASAEPDALLAAGCPDRRLGVLPGQFAAVLNDHDHLLLGAPEGLNAEQLAELNALAALLPAACAALEACGLPYTLEHGDLHGNNIAVMPSGFVYFDWSDACLSHPFICLITFLETVRPDWHAALTQAYLEEWGAYASPEQLQRALRLSQPLGAAHLAISYHRILATTEASQRWQLAGALPFFLREFLKYKEALLTLVLGVRSL